MSRWSRWSRWAPLCGVIFVGLMVTSFALSGSSPGVKASGAKVVSYYTAHRGHQQASGFMGMYGVVFFLFFAGCLRGYLRRLRPEAGTLAALSLAGAVLLAVGGSIFTGLQIALSDAPSALSADAAQALNVISNDLFVPLIAGTCVFMIANGLAIVRDRALPVWLGWIALLIGVVTVTPIGFFGFLATLAWVLIVSILMVIRASHAAVADTDQPAAAT
jgi:hypothetical protein